jgi:hypothetical protein
MVELRELISFIRQLDPVPIIVYRRWRIGAIQILDFRSRILDLTTGYSAKHQLPAVSVRNPNSKFQNQDCSILFAPGILAAVEKYRAAGMVSVSIIAHSRISFSAGLNGVLAARMKRATTGFIRRIWHRARDAVEPLAPFFSIGERCQQRLGVGMFRVFENLLPVSLFCDDAGIHDTYAIGYL